jgi:hypothetical protein
MAIYLIGQEKVKILCCLLDWLTPTPSPALVDMI